MRRPDWEQRLHDVITANHARPHEFGKWDCLLWPAAAIKAVTGKDPARGHRGKYNSLATAYRYLQQLGFDSPAALLSAKFPEKPIGFAQRGDLVLVKTETGETPGVCIGHVALVAGEQGETEGLIRAPRQLWLKAWAVE